MILFWMAIWVACGHLAHIVDKKTPKLPGQDTIDYWRCLILGPIMLGTTILCYFAEPSDDE